MTALIDVKINGKDEEINTEITIMELIESKGLKGRRIAIEINEEIISASQHNNHIIKEHDVIEIVHAIGGG